MHAFGCICARVEPGVQSENCTANAALEETSLSIIYEPPVIAASGYTLPASVCLDIPCTVTTVPRQSEAQAGLARTLRSSAGGERT